MPEFAVAFTPRKVSLRNLESKKIVSKSFEEVPVSILHKLIVASHKEGKLIFSTLVNFPSTSEVFGWFAGEAHTENTVPVAPDLFEYSLLDHNLV